MQTRILREKPTVNLKREKLYFDESLYFRLIQRSFLFAFKDVMVYFLPNYVTGEESLAFLKNSHILIRSSMLCRPILTF